MHMANKMSNIIGTENIILLFKELTPRELAIIKNNNSLDISPYSTQDFISMFSEYDNQPCFFVLDKNLNISNTFYPIKGKANFNQAFYDYIKRTFKNKL